MNYSNLSSEVPEVVFSNLVDVTTKYQINTQLRLAHFLSQCSHESAGFTRVEENLNYSLEALLRVFPKYFDPGNVKTYARNPMKIASRVYANRMGNGDESSLEGWVYRGRGYIQLTGKDNYAKFGDDVSGNLISNPDLVATKYSLLSAAWFWNQHNLNDVADQGHDQNTVANITKIINGGYNGLEDRQNKFTLFFSKMV